MKRVLSAFVATVAAALLLRSGLRRVVRGVALIAASAAVGVVGAALFLSGLVSWFRQRRRRAP